MLVAGSLVLCGFPSLSLWTFTQNRSYRKVGAIINNIGMSGFEHRLLGGVIDMIVLVDLTSYECPANDIYSDDHFCNGQPQHNA